MEETKSYKNINLNELRTSPVVVKKSAKVAMFVPRLIAKLSTKLVINPITKIYSGIDYEQVKNATLDLTMQMQEAEAAEIKKEIYEGRQTLVDFKEDREYYISNLATYRAYQTYIDKLSKKYNKVVSSPKRLLVAKNYLVVMKKFKEKNKEIKRNAKLVQEIINEYQERTDEVIVQKLKIKELEEALANAKSELVIATGALEHYKKENQDIIDQIPVVMGDTVEQEVNEPILEAEPAVTPFETPEVNPVVNNEELSEQELDNVVAGVPIPTEERVNNTFYQTPVFNMPGAMPHLNPADQDLLVRMGYFGGFSQAPDLEQGKSL